MSGSDNSKHGISFDYFLRDDDDSNSVPLGTLFAGIFGTSDQHPISAPPNSCSSTDLQSEAQQPLQQVKPQSIPSSISQPHAVQQPPIYSMQPKAPQNVKYTHPKLTSSSLVAICQNWNQMCVYTTHNLVYPIWPFAIERVCRVVPDKYFRQTPFFEIRISNVREPVRIHERDIFRTGFLRDELAKASGAKVFTCGFPRKMDELLREFIQCNSEVIDTRLYYGWIWKESLDFKLCNRKTHGEKNASPNSSDSIFTIPTLNRSSALTALMQTSKIMQTIANESIRQTVWIYTHAAIMYSLLAALDFQLPMGLCIYSQNQNVRRCMEEIFSWFGDKPISLEETPAKLRDHMVERKDQPLLLTDEAGTASNIRTLMHCLQTGGIPYPEKLKIDDPKLEALPIVITAGNSPLRYNSDLFLLEIDADDLVEDAYAKMQDLKCYFEEYLFSFIRFVIKNAGLLVPTLRKHIDTAYGSVSTNYDIPRKMLDAFGILSAVTELSKMHLEKLLPDDEVTQYLNALLPSDCEKLFLASHQERLQSQNPPADTAYRFFEAADEMIRNNLFDVRNCSETAALNPCAEGKLGIIYIDDKSVSFPNDSFSAICEKSNCNCNTMMHALRDEKHLLGPTINSSTVKSYIDIPQDDSETKRINVYKLKRDHFKSLKVEAKVLKDDAECDFTLQLGLFADGSTMSWRGTENSHISITGLTGTGKSFLIRKLIAQLPEQNVRCIVFDCAGDYAESKEVNPEGWPVPGTQIINMKDSPIHMLPFSPIYPGESQNAIANRIMNTISVPLGFGKRQQSFLLKTISAGLQNNSLNEFADLRDLLKKPTKSKETAESVILALDSLWDSFPSGGKTFDWDFSKPGITVLNLHQGFSDLSLNIFLEMLIGSIYSARMTVALEDYPPLVLVLDECHRLNWSENSFANRIMREGRKYGLAVLLSTQYLTNENLINAFGQTELCLSFRPAKKDVLKVAKTHFISNSAKRQKCAELLETLHRGQFLFVKDGEIFVSADPAK